LSCTITNRWIETVLKFGLFENLRNKQPAKAGISPKEGAA